MTQIPPDLRGSNVGEVVTRADRHFADLLPSDAPSPELAEDRSPPASSKAPNCALALGKRKTRLAPGSPSRIAVSCVGREQV
jgi:hypothetical protein